MQLRIPNDEWRMRNTICQWANANAITNYELRITNDGLRMTNEENNLPIDRFAHLLFFLALFAILGALCVPRVRGAGSQCNDE